MRLVTGIALLTVLLLAGCTSSGTPLTPVVPPTAEPTATVEPTATTEPTATVEPTATAVPLITAANAASLQADDPVTVQHPYQMLWSPDSASLLVGDDAGLHTIASDGRGAIALTDTQAITGSLSFAADGTLAALQDNHVINVYAPESLQLRQTIPFSGTATSVTISPDGRQLAVTSADNIAVTLYDTATGQPTATLSGFETAAPVYGIRFDPTWHTAIWLARASVQLMDVATGQLGARFEHEDFVADLALSPDGRLLATAAGTTINGQSTPAITLWDTQTGAKTAVLPQPAIVTSVSFSPDGALLAAGDIEGNILLWDVNQQSQVAALNDHVEQVRQVAFSPDGRFLAASDGQFRLWHP